MRHRPCDLLSVVLAVCIFINRSRAIAESCDYYYLLQPPSELPCNPYQPNEETGEQEYTVNLQCAIAQTAKIRDDSHILWIQQTQDSEQRRLPVEPNQKYKQTSTVSTVRGTVIYQSVLHILGHPPPNNNNTHSYWCKRRKHDSDVTANTPATEVAPNDAVSPNRLTVYGPDFYSLLPPCLPETPLHLAASVCVKRNSSSIVGDPPIIPCSTTSEGCSGDGIDVGSGSSEDDTTSAIDTVVIIGASVGSCVIIALVAVVCVLVLCLCLRRRNKRNNNSNGAEYQYPERHNGIVSPTPPSIAASTPSSEQRPAGAVVSERVSPLFVPSLVVPQKPTKPPPTLPPASARSRGASLFRQLQRPLKRADKKGVGVSTAKNEFDGDVRSNEQGSPPRKKPYKSLELNTVDSPHLYMTRAKSPMHVEKPRPRKPPPVLQSNPRTVSREKLLLTLTTSNGYIIPGSGGFGPENEEEEEEEGGQMYQEIETETQDYLALYTVPQQSSPSTSSEQQPIYEEPRHK